LHAFGQPVEPRQLRREPAVDAYGVRDWRAQRLRLRQSSCGKAVFREREGALGDRGHAREAPLLDLRGRKPEALELRHRAFASLSHPARLRRSLLDRPAIFGNVVRDVRAGLLFLFDELCHVRYVLCQG
jgi:hypothetical protein